MRSGDCYVTREFVKKNLSSIEYAMEFDSLARFSPRRKIVEMCREEFRYSENTLPGDIWGAIMKVYYLIYNKW